MAEGKTRKASAGFAPEPADGEWKEHHGDTYRCVVYLTSVPGGYSARAPTLPGIVAQGGTEQEALANVQQALVAAIKGYKATGGRIPWTEAPSEETPGATVRWVFVRL